MQTGDILLFKGNGLFSSLIMAAPGADYSHVGLYVNHPVHGSCVFESTSLGTLPDMITGESICGVQMVPFDERIASYDGEVFHRPIYGDRGDDVLTSFMGFIDKHHGAPYEEDTLQLIRAELDIFPWQKNKPDASSLFCSETSVMCLRECGIIIDDDMPANEFTPTDLSDDVMFAVNGFRFGAIVAL